MSNEKFKVKFGLAVGDTAATVDGTTGDIVTNGDITVGGNDIKSNGGTTAIALSGADITTGDITLNGGDIRSSGGTVAISVSGADATVAADLAVNGGDITTTASLANIFNTTASTVNLGGAATTVSIGNNVGTTTVNNALAADSITTSGDAAINGGDITTNAATATVFNATATTLNMGGAATTVSIGANTGTTTINNSLVADDISIATVDTTTLKVTNIQAKDGTAAATIANSTGIITVSSELNVDNINISGNTISSTDSNGNIVLTPNGTGVVTVSSDLAVNGATSADITTTTTTASLFNATATTVNIGAGASTALNIGNASGTLTLAPSTVVGTQTTQNLYNTVATTLNLGGAATTTNIGANTGSSIINGVNRFTSPAIFNFAGANNYRGLMISNGNTSSTPAARTGMVLRTFPTATAPRGAIIFENSRGTESSPTALQGPSTTQVGDFLGEIVAGGRTSTGWVTDLVAAAPLGFTSYATENWVSTTNVGTGWALQLQPTATTLTAGGASRITTIDSSPQNLSLRSDLVGISKGKTIQFVATGCSVSGTTLTIGTVSSGTVAVGAMLNQSTGLFPAGTYIVANISGSGAGSTWTLNQAPGNNSGLTIVGQQGYMSMTGTGNVDIMGNLTVRGGTTAAGYGEFAYVNAAGFGFVAQNTIYAMPLDTTNYSSNVTTSNTSRINISKIGKYKIIMSLQAAMSTNTVGQFEFWLRKTGVDIANSATQVDLLKDQKSVIAMDWMVDCTTTADYWEIMYATTSANYANITFPTIAAQASPYVRPLAPALIVNVIPIGI